MRNCELEEPFQTFIEKISSLIYEVVVIGGVTEEEILGDLYGNDANMFDEKDEVVEWCLVWEHFINSEFGQIYLEEQQRLNNEVNFTLKNRFKNALC